MSYSDLEPLSSDEGRQVGNATGVSPPVIVPGDDFDHRATHDYRREPINDRGMRVASEVGGDQGFLSVVENALECLSAPLAAALKASFTWSLVGLFIV
jgi:hypothetical protein